MTRLVWDVAVLLATLDGGTRPQAFWDAALATLPAAGRGPRDDVTDVCELAVVDAPSGALLWDVETLGTPRPLDLRGGVLSLLAEVQGSDPRTWAGVRDGRYAAGSIGSYLVARATRGLEHVGLAGTAPGPADLPVVLAADLPMGVADDVLPEVVAPGPVGSTDPACCGGLLVPLLLLPG